MAWLQSLYHRGSFPPCPPFFFTEQKQLWNTLLGTIISQLTKKNIIFKIAFKRGYVSSLEVTVVEFPSYFLVMANLPKTTPFTFLVHRTQWFSFLTEEQRRCCNCHTVHTSNEVEVGLDMGGLELNTFFFSNAVFKSSLRIFKNRAQLTTLNDLFFSLAKPL